jgi:hypothetical protein
MTMKCQSDYDNEEQAILRQGDECLQDWWDPESADADKMPPKKADDVVSAAVTAEAEAIKRGLLKADENGDLCISCPEPEK